MFHMISCTTGVCVCVKSAAAPFFQVFDERQQLRVLCLCEVLAAFAVPFQANGDGIVMPWDRVGGKELMSVNGC